MLLENGNCLATEFGMKLLLGFLSQVLRLNCWAVAFKPFEKKEMGLGPYQFSIVIENSREPTYFSEKLIDCLLCNTIPIYWGAPNVDQYFDTDGMIICQNVQEIQKAINTVTEEDYQRLSQVAPENHERALSYINQELHIAKMLQKEICISRRAA